MQAIRENLSNLQASLKKRVDLANQIIDIASGYGDHEKLTHLSLSANQGSIENVLSLAQNYPELKANSTYQQLMAQLESIEESILERREAYNARVKDYNSYRNSFPPVLIASKLSFDTAPYFDINDEDFSNKVSVFNRDDSAALQEVILSGANSVKKSAISVKQSASTVKNIVEEKIDEAKKKQLDDKS